MSTSPRIRLVSFDLDDTLYPETGFVRGGLMAAGAALDAFLGRPVGAGRVLLDVLAEGGPIGVLDRALDRIGVPRDEALVARLVRAFRDHAPAIAPFSGAPEMLEDLRARGARLALVTDGYPDVQRRKVAALRLAHLFETVVFTGDVEGRAAPKPDPAAFRLVERTTGVAGPEAVHVGDTPARDFPPAEACGWRTVRARYPGGYHSLDPDPGHATRVEARSIGELHAILAAMV
ncbi:MAG: HAD family hydrolase [Deltaproteobacteria bacterium]|nr:HAD family hydrolase [Deltaproteobacteria bacterium]